MIIRESLKIAGTKVNVLMDFLRDYLKFKEKLESKVSFEELSQEEYTFWLRVETLYNDIESTIFSASIVVTDVYKNNYVFFENRKLTVLDYIGEAMVFGEVSEESKSVSTQVSEFQETHEIEYVSMIDYDDIMCLYTRLKELL